MKIREAAILLLIFAVAITVGCIQSFGPDPHQSADPVQTPEISETPRIPVPQPSFSLGDHYLKKSYTFQSEQDLFTEEFRVDNASWGIVLTITPLTENVIYSWFEMKVTNLNNNQSDSYGYGRTHGFDLKRLIPMYNVGLYKIEMRGNRVKVDVTVAKRNP